MRGIALDDVNGDDDDGLRKGAGGMALYNVYNMNLQTVLNKNNFLNKS
jgi:hypothetical protein